MGAYSGKLIVVTGAAGGIGRETVPIFLDGGADLLLIDRDADRLDGFAHALAAGDRVRTAASTIDTPEACETALAAAEKPVFALVHLAGVYEADEVKPGYRDVWDRMIAGNLTNAWDMAAACAHRFDPDGVSRMVFVSSLAFRRGSFDHIAYSSAKGGLTGLVRAMSRRLAPKVLVNGLAPGIIDTPMPAPIIVERGDRLRNEIPLRRWGHAREVGTVINFLCSDASSYITGQVINVDGGIVNS